MSNHDPYTPETIDVKMAYITSFDPEGVHKILAHMVAEMTTGHAADFDRWLRGVKAEAWLEGHAQGFYAGHPDGAGTNPHEDPVE